MSSSGGSRNSQGAISDDPSDDEVSLMNALREEQDSYRGGTGITSPYEQQANTNLSRGFRLSNSALQKLEELASRDLIRQEERELYNPSGEGSSNMWRRNLNPLSTTPESRGNESYQSSPEPTPRTRNYIEALINPMAAHGELDNEFDDMIDTSAPQLPGSPPAYSSTDLAGPAPPFRSASRRMSRGGLVSQVEEQMAKVSITRDNTHSSDDAESLSNEGFTGDELTVLSYVDAYKAEEVQLTPKLKPFDIEYMPAYGEVDLFVKVPRPDDIDDNAGLTQRDEPPCEQSDATIVDMQIRNAVKDAKVLDDAVPVKVLHNADKNPDKILKWIADVKEHRKNVPKSTVTYKTINRTVEDTMQELPAQIQKAAPILRAPPAEIDCDLKTYVEMCLNLVDIPVGDSLIESVHLMFATFIQFKNSQHFKNLEYNLDLLKEKTEKKIDVLEL
ncbi:hypothetical protein B9Z55_023586 [Caenorhabditis nigoni]|uniref:Intraflagellar transport protein 46 homolog n=1 Tax=Caenorhabditis nigoni TaxID=1611254 RepID=A0A2G5SQA4_9PELO|nr:hypothetical protein B9Z55_023586 [Caenorhabditis nigoni]